jgi:hypothetical protein
LIKRDGRQSSISGKARFFPNKNKRTGPESRADALGEVSFD